MIKTPNPIWPFGSQVHLAAQLRIRPAQLSDILHRRIGVSTRRARQLERITGIPALEWLTSKYSKHPAFYGEPKQVK